MTYNKNTWANHDLITSQKLNNIEDGINDVIDRVTYGTGGAEQPTQPIHTPVYLNLGDPLPTDAVSGDYAFIKDGDDFTIMEFNGVKWVEQINPNLKERIADVLAQAETRSQELVDENAKAIGATLDDVQAKQADLTAKQAELDTKAQGYANKALADAKANTLATATQTAKDAQEYTNTAKAEAISVATTADGVINQKIDDTASSITRTINQNKSDADGKISTAQSTATQALDGLTQKVSQNTYDAKVNELTGKISTAQQTADGVVTTVGNYKTSNDERVRAAESAISQNAENIALKVAKTDYDQKTGELSGKISEVSQTAGKISQSVSDVKAQVDGLSVGGRNLILGTANDTTWMADSSSNYSFRVIATGLKPGKTYTFSAEVTLGNTDQRITTVSLFNEPIGQYLASNDNFKADGTRDHWTFTVPITVNTPTASLIIYAGTPGSTRGKSATYHHIKLETGNMPSDWSPAPEDTDNKISTVSQTVDSISSIVSDPTIGLTKRIQTAEGTLSQVTGADIPNLQKATYWQAPNGYDLNTYLTQGSFFFANTNARTNNPKADNGWMYLVVEQANGGSHVTQTAWYDSVTSAKVTYKRQYTSGTWGAWYANDNDSVASIAQTNGAIQTEISNRQTGDTNTLTQAKDFTTSAISNSETGMKSLLTQTSDTILGKVGAVNLFPNSEFEKDYGYRMKTGNTALSLDSKNNVDGKFNGVVWVASTDSAYQGYWARNIPVYGGQSYSMSTLVHYTNGGLSNGIALLDVWFVDKDGNRISTGTIGTGGSNKSSTGQVSSPYWVKLYIENLIAPTNAVNMQVSLLVNNAGAGQMAAFTQPMVTATEKLQSYTPNNDITTQLALLKDNWSIGIADNAGAITNGIVGNSTNMSLISNNVTINSPQTQIKGTAWINSAMIGNGQIGNAQIGDASISSAKIMNLDVNKITGNVSSFIQSNWNGKYASTSIDSSGMSINGGSTTTKFDTSGAHYSNSSGISATYSFGKWSDQSGRATSSTGLYLGATGSENAFINILGTNGAAALVLAGSAMDYGSNLNVMQGTLNSYVNVNIRTQLHFKGNKYNSPSYIEINESNRTFNFWTGGGSVGSGNYFYFNQNVISAGTFSSTSVLSKKNVKSVYDEDALGEIAKTQLVNFEYKNRIGQNHVSPIIDDVNSEKEYYIPKTILGQDNEYVDMYSMISMAWRAIQQLNEKIGEK